MHGLGNDFVVVDARANAIHIGAKQAKLMAHRRFGIGCDQLLILKPAQGAGADLRMEIFNTDGSVAEMCGNGIRAVALYVHKRDPSPKASYKIETLAGLKTVEIQGDEVRVDMGPPQCGQDNGEDNGEDNSEDNREDKGEDLDISGLKLRFFEVGMGNPHAVFFVSDLERPFYNYSPGEIGPLIETHSRFPARTNVEFVVIENENKHSLKLRVWERGAGLTLACGTGACAAAVAAIATGRAESPVAVHLPGGTLEISWAGGASSVFMTGPAVEVFSGEFRLCSGD
jgi:diaminopimelate epimerase